MGNFFPFFIQAAVLLSVPLLEAAVFLIKPMPAKQSIQQAPADSTTTQ